MPPNRRLLAELESHNKVSTISEKAALYAPATGKRDRRKPTRFVAQPQNDEQVGRAVTRYSLVSLSGGRRKRKKGGNDDGQTPHQNRLVDEVESQKQLSRVRELAELRNRSRFKGKDRQTLWNVAKHARGEIAAHEIEETVRIGSISNMEETPLPLGEAISSSISDNNIGTNEIKEGYKIRKAFTFWYEGQVISEKPEWRYCNVENQDFEMWKVRYIDNDEEELTREHLEECHANYVASRKPQLEQKAGTSTTATSPICTSHPEDIDCYNEAFLDLCNRVGFTHQEVRIVLSEMKRPYCLNTAVQRIIKRKDDTGRARHMQRRELRMLELFAGDAVVSEAFHRYSSFWRTRSIDNNPTSRATDRVDFMKLTWNNIGTVPDFVWISLPYFTCGKQRSPKDDQFAKTPEALEQDRYLARIAWFLDWAKKKKGHMIAVIENPVEWLSDKPIMKTIVDKMNFHPTTVNYCAFGRNDKKPTNLWTNDLQLHRALSIFGTCSPETCSFYGKPHRQGTRSSVRHRARRNYNPAAIPKDLADIVVDSISAKFSINDLNVRYRAEPEVTEKEIEFFNRMMGCAE